MKRSDDLKFVTANTSSKVSNRFETFDDRKRKSLNEPLNKDDTNQINIHAINENTDQNNKLRKVHNSRNSKVLSK